MLKRIVSAVIGLPFLLAVIIAGETLLFIAFLVISLIALWEFYNGCKSKFTPMETAGYTGSIIILTVMNFTLQLSYILMLFSILVIILNIIKLIHNNKYNFVDISITLYSLVYIPFLLGHILLISKQPNNIIIWLVFITAWGTDTLAYFSGYLFGRRELCPSISPKKTIEGAIGGTLGSMVVSLIFGYFFLRDHLFVVALIGILGSVVAQIGDLSASLIKRYIGIKDFGNIMPGHGGILDRFDSILFTAPIIYYILIFIINR
ncbi:MAG: phosphatidate cytidylyltransferase [Natronincolaceae bacterium]|nr:phosphatidate cytidylyltransferase [Bacillota bacterium]NLK90783.1 phosphatidate cytidylyltransferase [Clostridiales bacterium]